MRTVDPGGGCESGKWHGSGGCALHARSRPRLVGAKV